MSLGNILPTKKSLAINDRVFADNQQRQAQFAKSQKLDQFRREVVGMEVRFYKSETQYCIVNRSGNRILWFEIRGNETYSIKR